MIPNFELNDSQFNALIEELKRIDEHWATSCHGITKCPEGETYNAVSLILLFSGMPSMLEASDPDEIRKWWEEKKEKSTAG